MTASEEDPDLPVHSDSWDHPDQEEDLDPAVCQDPSVHQVSEVQEDHGEKEVHLDPLEEQEPLVLEAEEVREDPQESPEKMAREVPLVPMDSKDSADLSASVDDKEGLVRMEVLEDKAQPVAQVPQATRVPLERLEPLVRTEPLVTEASEAKMDSVVEPAHRVLLACAGSVDVMDAPAHPVLEVAVECPASPASKVAKGRPVLPAGTARLASEVPTEIGVSLGRPVTQVPSAPTAVVE